MLLCCRQENSDTSPTSYGEIQTVGSTGGSSSKSRLGFLDASADDDDLQSYKNAKREVQHDAEEAKQEAGNRFAAFKENITAATGDLQEDLQQLNVEVCAYSLNAYATSKVDLCKGH